MRELRNGSCNRHPFIILLDITTGYGMVNVKVYRASVCYVWYEQE